MASLSAPTRLGQRRLEPCVHERPDEPPAPGAEPALEAAPTPFPAALTAACARFAAIIQRVRSEAVDADDETLDALRVELRLADMQLQAALMAAGLPGVELGGRMFLLQWAGLPDTDLIPSQTMMIEVAAVAGLERPR